ncbi:hypothetical protein Tsubulata_029860, partial [Turnera subulata]
PNAPQSLKDIVNKCQGQNRVLMFNNLTKDPERKKAQQQKDIFSAVKEVLEHNQGKPYTNEYFKIAQEEEKKRIEAEKKLQALKEEDELAMHNEMKRKLEKQRQKVMKEMTERIKSQLVEELMKETSGRNPEASCCSIL